jgi:hypothetical protein
MTLIITLTIIMKNREIFSTGLSAFCGLTVLAVTLFNTEMKLWLMEHWMVVVFFFGLFLVSLSLISIWVRFILTGIIKEYYIPLNNEVNDLRKKFNNLIESGTDTAEFTGIKKRIAQSLLIRLLRFFI